LDEAPQHPHMRHRETFIEVAGVTQPAPAPRFSRTTAEVARPPSFEGQHTEEVLDSFGFSAEKIASLKADKAVV